MTNGAQREDSEMTIEKALEILNAEADHITWPSGEPRDNKLLVKSVEFLRGQLLETMKTGISKAQDALREYDFNTFKAQLDGISALEKKTVLNTRFPEWWFTRFDEHRQAVYIDHFRLIIRDLRGQCDRLARTKIKQLTGDLHQLLEKKTYTLGDEVRVLDRSHSIALNIRNIFSALEDKTELQTEIDRVDELLRAKQAAHDEKATKRYIEKLAVYKKELDGLIAPDQLNAAQLAEARKKQLWVVGSVDKFTKWLNTQPMPAEFKKDKLSEIQAVVKGMEQGIIVAEGRVKEQKEQLKVLESIRDRLKTFIEEMQSRDFTSASESDVDVMLKNAVSLHGVAGAAQYDLTTKFEFGAGLDVVSEVRSLMDQLTVISEKIKKTPAVGSRPWGAMEQPTDLSLFCCS